MHLTPAPQHVRSAHASPHSGGESLTRAWRLAPIMLIVALALLLTACAPAQQIGPRPASDALGSVEAYMRRYQPGPLPRVFQTTRFYDRRGKLLAERWHEGRRTWVPLNRISKHLIDATIATEDVTFYMNVGVDPARIAGAALQNAQEGEIMSGASTITMQLARNIFLGPDDRYDQSMDRKMLEAGIAQELTILFSKEEILEMYLNLLNYGHLTYGPEAAAQIYFGKSAADLTVAEATLLAGVPQRPAAFDLFRNFEAAKARQRVVLDMMVRHNFLSPAEADVVYSQPIALNPNPDPTFNITPHFIQYIEDTLNSQFGPDYAARSGLNITTTLDLDMQNLAQSIVAKNVVELGPKYNMGNSALVAMRPGANEIMAMVGSADFNNDEIDGQVNVAVSPRQPGSAIKPILYATALSDNLISPATVLWDIPVTYTMSAGNNYVPVNYDGKFHGPVTARTALANSYNIPAVKLLAAVTVDRMVESARAMGMLSLDPDSTRYGLSLTLGGGEVSLLDLTTSYATLANGGRYLPAKSILAATNALGRPVDLFPAPEPQQVISPAAAFQTTDILSDNDARKPMFGENSPLRLSRPAAAKTGTTTKFRDNWTAGYTRYLVTGVWSGNSDGRPMRNTTGVTGAAPIWHTFMEAVIADPALLASLDVPADPTTWEFPPPEDVQQRPDCPPGLTCRPGGEFFSKKWLRATGEAGPLADSVAVVPTAPVYVQGSEGTRWTSYCQTEPAVHRRLLRLPGQLGPPSRRTKLNDNGRLEQLRAIAWSLRRPTPVDLGACDKLNNIAKRAVSLDRRGGEVGKVLVDYAAALNQDAGPVPASTPAALTTPEPVAIGSGYYVLAQPVTHHNVCPGNYIVGQILNSAMAPVSGIRISLVDQWGNRAEAISKSGKNDFGSYDFPINDFANQYTLTVTDEAGNPASPPIVIDHLQGPSGDSPCHTVTWIEG